MKRLNEISYYPEPDNYGEKTKEVYKNEVRFV